MIGRGAADPMTLKILAGDFKKGRVPCDDIGFRLKSVVTGKAEPAPYGSVQALHALGHDKHGSIKRRVATAAGAGLVGGVAAGAAAGATGGPIGAAVGAVAGAIFAARKRMLICRVDLRDGRSFTAIAAPEFWAALHDTIERAPVVPARNPAPRAEPPVAESRV
jgi:hypothetical protein